MNKFTVVALITILSIPIIGGSIQDAFALAVRPGFDSNTLAPNDDDSTIPAVNLGFSGDGKIKFFSFETTEAYVNNNGNISFDNPLATFTPFDLSTTNRQIIAPFFADVDTRFTGMPVTYGTGTVDGRDAFGVNWVMVDCNGVATPNPPPFTVFNTFQLILIERFDTGSMNFDIELNYDSINWETGDVNDVADCLGGSSARIGYSDGTLANSFEFPGSAVNGAFLDSGPVATSLIQNSLNSPELGRYIIPVRNGIPNPEPIEIIGGEIIAIDSISLLLAATTSTSLLITILFSGIIIGSILINKILKKN